MSPSPPACVVKIGGSLLDYTELPAKLNAWLAAQPNSTLLLIAGGGRIVDIVRDADQNYDLGEQLAHWMCVDLLATTSQILHHLVPKSKIIENLPPPSTNLAAKQVFILNATRFLRDQERYLAAPLPQGWHVTTDSIAARVAELLRARLVLLKSADAPENTELQNLADNGYVDRYFPTAADGLTSISYVNLRTWNG